ncbi:LCP family protein [Pseudonocardia sp. H11422]|uniref:LCP family protein n=1 Tax=Pseudonocardia sp. H11422 TaxID=2835866 RepID=UPI00292EB7E1|nr:LCP family protein [Pseudonocardia sp. H11422]
MEATAWVGARRPTRTGPDAPAPDPDAEAPASGDVPVAPDTAATEDERRRRIDASLTRLTAAHAGLLLSRDDDRDENGGSGADPDDDPDDDDPSRSSARGEHGRTATSGRPEDPLRRRGLLAARLLAAGVAMIVFASTALGWAAKTWLDSTIRSVAALDRTSGAIADPPSQLGDENVLLLGLDPGPAGTAFAPGAGSDTIVVAHVPADGSGIVTVGFPRDLEINRPPCQRWDAAAATYLDQTVPAETRTKLDSAFEVGGPACAVRVIQQLTGLAITQFVALDVTGLGSMVDAVDGISVCVERPVVDSILGTVVPTAGTTTLDGGRALDLVRARHVEGDPATDQGLIQRQQRVLAALLRKALSNQVLLNPGTLRAFAGEFGRSTLSDGAGLDELVALARSLQSLDGEAVTFVPLPVTGETTTRGNAVLRDRDANALFAALRSGEPLPEAVTAPAPDAATGPDPASITVDVLNASDRTGLATQIGGTLRELGFSLGTIGNAPEPSAESLIRFSPDRAAAAQVLADTVPSARSVPDSASSGRLQLVLGASFDGTVRALAEPGPATAPATSAEQADCS